MKQAERSEPITELRIGLVLYGGVSLAVYINGVATEMWNALRASRSLHEGGGIQAEGGADTGGVEDCTKLSGSAAIYRKLMAELSGSPQTRKLKIVVDAIAGTSAGGLNGAVLAKAIIEGGDASALNRTWIEEADLAKLRVVLPRAPWWLRVGARVYPRACRLRRRVESEWGLDWLWAVEAAWNVWRTKSGDRTPLNGGYFTQMIARTLRDMGSGPALLPPRGTLDLFLTRTDLFGWPRHLPVSPDYHPVPLFERHHAHMIRFHRRQRPSSTGGRAGAFEPLGDFDLTFAARTTAGFPFAFAPVTYREVAADYKAACPPGTPLPQADTFARGHLREHGLEGFRAERAWMADGGLLDNKPFTDLSLAIEAKPADHQVYRAVVYIEPDPVPAGRLGAGDDDPPHLCPLPLTVLKQLFGVVRSEPILEDLRRLDLRNHRVRTMQAIRKQAFDDAARIAKEAGTSAGLRQIGIANLDRWRQISNEAAAHSPHSGYAGYVALKARRAASVASDAVCSALDLPYHSRHGYFVRTLLRDWLERRGALRPPTHRGFDGYRLRRDQLQLLEAFDLPFRLRRLRFLVQEINKHYDESLRRGTQAASNERQQLDATKRALAEIAFRLEDAYLDITSVKEDLSRSFGKLLIDEIVAVIDTKINAPFDGDRQESSVTYDRELGLLYRSMRRRLSRQASCLNREIPAALAKLPRDARRQVCKALVAFPILDVLLYPIMDAAEVTDLFEVRTMRVSPHDRSLLAGMEGSLKGRELYAFAGFLKREWREHDLLWGRLDGAERLIDLIFDAAVPDDADRRRLKHVRDRFARQAMEAVLDEASWEASSTAELADEVRAHFQVPHATPAVA